MNTEADPRVEIVARGIARRQACRDTDEPITEAWHLWIRDARAILADLDAARPVEPLPEYDATDAIDRAIRNWSTISDEPPADEEVAGLVERLRSLADLDARSGEPLGKCMREAAATIERLSAEVADLEAERDTIWHGVDELRELAAQRKTEVADLRARLGTAVEPVEPPADEGVTPPKNLLDGAVITDLPEPTLVDNLAGPHEWGYRDPVEGDFVADDAPYQAIALIERQRAEIARLTRERDALAKANHRQANCMHQTAAALGPDYSFTIEGLPKAAAHVSARATAAEAKNADLRARLARIAEEAERSAYSTDHVRCHGCAETARDLQTILASIKEDRT